MVQTLPQGMTVDIWKMFVQHLKENHVAEENTGHILFILDIYFLHTISGFPLFLLIEIILSHIPHTNSWER